MYSRFDTIAEANKTTHSPQKYIQHTQTHTVTLADADTHTIHYKHTR